MLLFLGLGMVGLACQRADLPPSPTGSRALPIIGGTPDLTISAIGALVVQRQSAFCTGTLIAQQIVVTAAHCVESIEDSGLSTVTFRTDFPEANDQFRSEYHEILQIAKHPRYTSGSGAEYDIGLLILKNKVTNVTPLPFNRSPMDAAWIGKTIRVVGYGYIQTRPSYVYPDRKHAADIPLFQIDPSSFIHYDPTGAVSACHGDSGGPALFEASGKLRVMGVTSIAYRASPGTGGRTYCDGGAVSTRVDAHLDFLRPFLQQFGDGPEPCSIDQECQPCGLCQQNFCAPKPVDLADRTCKACQVDADCGDGYCHRFSTGFRCVQKCNAEGCCPAGSYCSILSTQGVLVKRACMPDTGACSPLACASDATCGLGETCQAGTCKPNPPPLAPQVCQPCYSSGQCGNNGFCQNSLSGLGFCTQSCGAGDFCPNGFACQATGPGIRQCLPQASCFQACTADADCPTGQTCNQSVCSRPAGSTEGEPCSQTKPCQGDLFCLSDTPTSGRCVKPCGPRSGAAGSPCGPNNACNDPALGCRSFFGVSGCFEDCAATNTCKLGGACTSLGRTRRYCACETDADCNPDQICNSAATGFIGACTPKPQNSNECRDGFSCRPLPGIGNFCLPVKGDGVIGSSCNYVQRCRDGLQCLRLTQEAGSLCMETCQGSCKTGGQCLAVDDGLNLCLCRSSQDCQRGYTCKGLFSTDQGAYGICQRSPDFQCATDIDCPAEHRCDRGNCVYDPSKQNPAPKTQEPVAEPQPENPAELQPENPAEPAAEPPSDAGAEATPEKNATETPTEKNQETVQTTVQGGCGCSSSPEPFSPILAFILVFLFLFRSRRP